MSRDKLDTRHYRKENINKCLLKPGTEKLGTKSGVVIIQKESQCISMHCSWGFAVDRGWVVLHKHINRAITISSRTMSGGHWSSHLVIKDEGVNHRHPASAHSRKHMLQCDK